MILFLSVLKTKGYTLELAVIEKRESFASTRG